MLRSYLYEAAGVLMSTPLQNVCAQSLGMRVAKRSGLRKAKVAVARKLAVICIACGSTAPSSMVIEELPLNRDNPQTTSLSSRIPAGRRTSLPGRRRGEIAPGFAMLNRAKRAFTH